MDQYSLFNVGLAVVRTNTQGTWESAFRTCNLDPRCQLPFPAWCTKISHFPQAGQTFKTETFKDDLYLSLTSIWHGMLPKEEDKCADIKGKN